jgi:hypothetical protein
VTSIRHDKLFKVMTHGVEMLRRPAFGLVVLLCIAACKIASVPNSTHDVCPSSDSVRAAFVRDSVTFAPGNVEGGEATTYQTVFINGVVWAANVRGSGAPGSLSDNARIPSLDSLGGVEEIVWYNGTVPAQYRVCPGVGAFTIVTKRRQAGR